MKYIKYILGVIVGLGALVVAFLFQRSKANTAEALLQNTKLKEDLLKVDTKISQNNTSLQQEEVKRNQLLEDMKKEKDEEVTTDNVLTFFNNRK